MRSRPSCQPPHDSTLRNPCEITEICCDWLTPSPSSFSPSLPPLHPVSQGFWRETYKEEKTNPDTTEIDLVSRGASRFVIANGWRGRENSRAPESLPQEERRNVDILLKEKSIAQKARNLPKATQTLPNASVTHNRLQLPSVSSKAPVVFLKRFKIKGNKAWVYVFPR